MSARYVLMQQHECDLDSCDGDENTIGGYDTIAEAKAAAIEDAEGSIDWHETPGTGVHISGYPEDKSGDLPDFWQYIITEAAVAGGTTP